MTVDVWTVSLDVSRARAAGLLSADERARAERYRGPEARTRFVITRATLRELLSRYVDVPPEELVFAYPCACGRADCDPSRRKPRLEPETLRFSVSHTDGLALIAVSRERELGVDVERVRPGVEIEALTKHVLGSPSEPEDLDAFYRAWTRREAHAKARGDGLAPPDERDGWWFSDLVPAPGYRAALAVEGDACAVETRSWPSLAD